MQQLFSIQIGDMLHGFEYTPLQTLTCMLCHYYYYYSRTLNAMLMLAKPSQHTNHAHTNAHSKFNYILGKDLCCLYIYKDDIFVAHCFADKEFSVFAFYIIFVLNSYEKIPTTWSKISTTVLNRNSIYIWCCWEYARHNEKS